MAARTVDSTPAHLLAGLAFISAPVTLTFTRVKSGIVHVSMAGVEGWDAGEGAPPGRLITTLTVGAAPADPSVGPTALRAMDHADELHAAAAALAAAAPFTLEQAPARSPLLACVRGVKVARGGAGTFAEGHLAAAITEYLAAITLATAENVALCVHRVTGAPTFAVGRDTVGRGTVRHWRQTAAAGAPSEIELLEARTLERDRRPTPSGADGPSLAALKGRIDLGREASDGHLAMVAGEEVAARMKAAGFDSVTWHAAHAETMATVAAAANGALKAAGAETWLRPRFLSRVPAERHTAEMATRAAATRRDDLAGVEPLHPPAATAGAEGISLADLAALLTEDEGGAGSGSAALLDGAGGRRGGGPSAAEPAAERRADSPEVVEVDDSASDDEGGPLAARAAAAKGAAAAKAVASRAAAGTTAAEEAAGRKRAAPCPAAETAAPARAVDGVEAERRAAAAQAVADRAAAAAARAEAAAPAAAAEAEQAAVALAETGVAAAAETAEGGASGTAAAPLAPGEWACSRCTLINTNKKRCSTCGQGRPKVPAA